MNSSHKQTLIQAINGILRPLVRVLIRNGFVHAEFTELVRQAYVEVAFEHYSIPGQDMSVSRVAVLDELNLVGVTRQPYADTVELIDHTYISHKDELGSFQIMSSSVTNLLKTAVHNIEAKSVEKYFQRQVVYSGVDEIPARRFRELSRQKATELIEEMNQYLSQGREKSRKKQAAEGKSPAQGRRIGLGIYYLQDSDIPPSEKTGK